MAEHTASTSATSQKPHWTQTPEGKTKARLAQLRSWRLRRLAGKGKLKNKPNYFDSEKRREILAEWERSGLSARMFGAKRGVDDKTLYAWRQQIKDKAKRGEARFERGNDGNTVASSKHAIVRVGRAAPQEQEQIETDIQYQNQICNAVGECKGFLRVYAESIGVPSRVFTKRVGELLFRSSHG